MRPPPARCRHPRSAAAVLVGLACLLPWIGAAQAASPQAEFARGVAEDLRGSQSAAFGLYRRAADAGLAEAQLNVAVMYDSGRGVAPDAAKAALYYALAASNGVGRAAYDLGQLYEAGDGVPRNPAMARAWFRQAASLGLPAGTERLKTMPEMPRAVAKVALAAPAAPVPAYPAQDAQLPASGRVSLVWSAPPEPAPTLYLVEIASLAGAPHDVIKHVTSLSAVSVPLAGGRFAWRVIAFCPSEARYTSTTWLRFTSG